jgi:hypothetical protein
MCFWIFFGIPFRLSYPEFVFAAGGSRGIHFRIWNLPPMDTLTHQKSARLHQICGRATGLTLNLVEPGELLRRSSESQAAQLLQAHLFSPVGVRFPFRSSFPSLDASHNRCISCLFQIGILYHFSSSSAT